MKSHNSKIRTSLKALVVIAFGLLVALPGAEAQRASGDVGIGVHIGQPTGLTVKLYRETTSIDFLAAWDFDDFFFLNVHALWDAHLNDANTIHFYYGPGGYIGIRDAGNNDNVAIGVSGAFGIDFLIDKFEIFLQATPRLELVEKTDFDFGGGVGFRFYL